MLFIKCTVFLFVFLCGAISVYAQVPDAPTSLSVTVYSNQCMDLTSISRQCAALSWTIPGTGATPQYVIVERATVISHSDYSVTNGSAVVTSATASFSNTYVGAVFTLSGGSTVPGGTTVLSYQSPTQITLSANVTTTGTGRTGTFYPWRQANILHEGLTKYWDYTVLPSTTYAWRIKQGNASGQSTASNEVTDSMGAAPSATGSLAVYSSFGTTTTAAKTDETLFFDARGSTNICERFQSDGTPSVTISFGDGQTANLLATAHTYRQPGTYTPTLTGKNCSGVAITPITHAQITVTDIAAASGGSTITDATCLSGGTGNNVQTLVDRGTAAANGVCLQTAVTRAAARSGEQEIVLPNGYISDGTITLPARTQTTYVTIKWANLAVTHRKRVLPADWTNAPIVLGISASNAPAFITSINVDPPSAYYRLQGIRLKRDVEVAGANDTGESGFMHILMYWGRSGLDTTIARIPHHLIIDRCWFGEQSGPSIFSKDGLVIGGDFVSVVDSWFAEFKRDVGADPNAIGATGGRGVVSIRNNYLVADSENLTATNTGIGFTATISSPTTTSVVLSSTTGLSVGDDIDLPFGGNYGATYSPQVTNITGSTVTFSPIPNAPTNGGTARWGTIISFYEVRENHLFKPNTWRPFQADGSTANPAWNGVTVNVKNLFELKSGRYWLLDGNVLENSWRGSQSYPIPLGSNCNGACNYANVIRDIQFSNNYILNVKAGMSLKGANVGPTDVSAPYRNFYIFNNLWRNLGYAYEQLDSTAAQAFAISGGIPYPNSWASMLPRNVEIVHNTIDYGTDNTNNWISYAANPAGYPQLSSGYGCVGCRYADNVLRDGGKGMHGGYIDYGGSVQTYDNAINIKIWVPPGDRTAWVGNGILGSNGHNYPTATTIIDTTYANNFVDWTNANFTLANGHALKNAALDGTDVGVNTTNLKTAIGAPSTAFGTAATTNAVTGDWTQVAGAAPVQVRGRIQMRGRVTVKP